MNLAVATEEMIGAKPVFMALNPGPAGLFTGTAAKVAKAVGISWIVAKTARKIHKGETVEAIAVDMLAGHLAGKVTSPVKKPLSRKVHAAHHHVANNRSKKDFWRKNGVGGRSWMNQPGRHEMVIIFHDANKAGPHIDVHLGRLSVIYKVKPDLYAKLRYNNAGYLTEESRKLIIEHVRWEINNGSRLPQNLDHSLTNARAEWVNGDRSGTSYGDGPTRQIVDISTVDVYKAHNDGPVEFYAPHLNPHRSMYLYKIYPGDGRHAPILIWGNKGTQPPPLNDRLHLKMIDPSEMHRIPDLSTATAKYDGSSCYVVINKKGTTVWSPRKSVKTGEQIEYTYKLDGIASITSDETIVGMGELLFKERKRWPWESEEYLPCAMGSGILNANIVLPDHVRPEIRLYRIDRIGRDQVGELPFWENRELQQQVATLDPQRLKVVELMSPEAARNAGYEGVVVVPQGSVNEGMKVKWWQDPDDWRIDRVAFEPGERGGMAGVVHCTSLESGKQFKLGPGQVGSREVTDKMMANPQDYEGTVLKVNSRHGHEGRAARVVGFHDDK